ncbi:MAG: chemotaxis protein CheW [Thermodesulfobacteriota bacterium]
MKGIEKTLSRRSDIVTFCVSDRWFGIEMNRVQEIAKTVEITPVCLMPPHIAGIVNLRGTIITVIDMASLLMESLNEDHPNRFMIIVQESNERVGFLVHQVGDVIKMDDSATFHPPANLMEQWRDVLVGVVQQKGQLIGVLDVDRLMQASMVQ